MNGQISNRSMLRIILKFYKNWIYNVRNLGSNLNISLYYQIPTSEKYVVDLA